MATGPSNRGSVAAWQRGSVAAERVSRARSLAARAFSRANRVLDGAWRPLA